MDSLVQSNKTCEHLQEKIKCEFLELLDTGGHSKVYSCTSPRGDQKFALKIMQWNEGRRILIKREIEILKILSVHKHNFVVSFVDSLILTESMICLVFHFVPGPTLRQKLHKQETFSEEEACFYSACMLLALKYLKQLHIIHGDIHLGNMILDKDNYPIMIDFGNGLILKDSAEFNHHHVEDLNDFARSIYEMLSGKYFAADENILTNKDISHSARNLLRKTLFSPKNSDLTVEHFSREQFFRNVKWDKLEKKEVWAPT